MLPYDIPNSWCFLLHCQRYFPQGSHSWTFLPQKCQSWKFLLPRRFRSWPSFWNLWHPWCIGGLGCILGNLASSSCGRASPSHTQKSCCTPHKQCLACEPSECDTSDLSKTQPPHRRCHNLCHSWSIAGWGRAQAQLWWMYSEQSSEDGRYAFSPCASSTGTLKTSHHTSHRAKGRSSSGCVSQRAPPSTSFHISHTPTSSYKLLGW